MSEHENRIKQASELFDKLFPLAKDKKPFPARRADDPMEVDAELIATFVRESFLHRVFVVSSYRIWEALNNTHFPWFFADSKYHRTEARLIVNIKDEANFIAHLHTVDQLRSKQLDKNTLVLISLGDLGRIGRERAFEVAERELMPRGCSIVRADY